MGVTGIQYAKLSGYNVITTASPRNFDYVKSLGADAVFDYNSASVADEIRAHTNNALDLAWDCQSTEQSLALIAKCMGPAGGRVGTLLPVPAKVAADVNDKVQVSMSLYYTMFGEPYTFFSEGGPVPEDYEFGKMFWDLSRGLLADGKVKPINVIKNRGGEGLEGCLVGLEEMKAGKVSAGKLVYTLQ